jgi:hypothetical protein
MTPLKVDEQGLPNGWADVQPGDAVVAFSRKDIYRARKVPDSLFGSGFSVEFGNYIPCTRQFEGACCWR